MTFDSGGDKRPSSARIAIWVVVGGIGAYLLLSGIIGILARGGA
ncbi:hypothetical protein [Microbacterium radiodurans]|nr:hypothetical protein [Microbacterium radiodurans]